MWQERRRTNSDPVWDLMCCDVDYSVPQLPSLQIYHCLMIYPLNLSIPPPPPHLSVSHLFPPSVLFTLGEDATWSGGVVDVISDCSIPPVLSVPIHHFIHFSLAPSIHPSIHTSLSVYLFVYLPRIRCDEEETELTLLWGRLQLPTVSVSHNLSFTRFTPSTLTLFVSLMLI